MTPKPARKRHQLSLERVVLGRSIQVVGQRGIAQPVLVFPLDQTACEKDRSRTVGGGKSVDGQRCPPEIVVGTFVDQKGRERDDDDRCDARRPPRNAAQYDRIEQTDGGNRRNQITPEKDRHLRPHRDGKECQQRQQHPGRQPDAPLTGDPDRRSCF